MAKNQNDRTQLFENYPIPKAVATLCIPTVLTSLVGILYSMADTYFVGLANDPVQTAAVTLSSTVMLAFNAVNNLFGVGGSSMMSRSLGAKDYKTMKQSSAFAFYGSLFSGILFAVLTFVFRTPLLNLLGADDITWHATSQYMNWAISLGAVPAIMSVVCAYMIRSEGASMAASIGTMSGAMLNIILDPIFIVVFHMGAEGAALATFISNCVAMSYFLVYILRKTSKGETYISISPGDFTVQRKISVGVCTVGIPASIQNLLNVVSHTILNKLASGAGAAALAALGICAKINQVPMFVSMGIAQGIMPLIAYNYASGNIKRMKETVNFTRITSVSFLVLASVVLWTGAGTIVGLFIKDPQTIAYGTPIMKAYSLGLVFMILDFLAVFVFQASGMGKESLIFAICRKVALEIPLTFVLYKFFGIYGLPYAQTLSELTLAIIATVILHRLFKKLEAQWAEKKSA